MNMKDNKKLSEMMISSLMMKASDTKITEVRSGTRLRMKKVALKAPKRNNVKLINLRLSINSCSQ